MKHRYWITGALLSLALVDAAMGAPQKAQRNTSPQRSAATPTGYVFEGQPRVAPGDAPGGFRDPKLAMHANRLLHLLAVRGIGERGALFVYSSRDGGDSWEEPLAVSAPDADVVSHGENSPSLAFQSGAIFALWEQRRADGGTDLMAARAVQMGRPFEKPVRVTDKTAPSSNSFSYLAAAPDGSLYAVWLDGRDRGAGAKGTSSVYMARSADRGATWGKNVRVAAGVCPCCRPTVAFGSGGEVLVSWRHVFPGDIRDIVVATSTDSGATWSEPVRVALDGWKIDGCPHTGAQMELKGSRIYITWYSEGAGGKNPGVRLSWTDNGGRSFAPAKILSSRILDANHPTLTTADDGRLLLLFQGRDPAQQAGWGPLRAYLVVIDDAGRASAPQLLPGKGRTLSYPVLLSASLGRLFVAWTQPGPHDESQSVLLRGRRASGSAQAPR